MLVLSAQEVIQALPMQTAIEVVKQAFAALSEGRAHVPLRQSLPISRYEAVSLFMPAYLETSSEEALAVKIVSVFPHNPAQKLPLIHAAVIVMDATTGRIQALLEGSSLTAIRTGAASGAATDMLARQDSHVVAIIGAGVQARTQLEAICTVRPIHTAWIFDSSSEKATQFVREMSGKGSVPQDLRLAKSAAQAIEHADIICTATTSTSPVFEDRYLKAGVHINGIGSYTPEMREVPTETVQRAYVVVDAYASALAEAGDILQPLREGKIDKQHIAAELGEIVLGKKPGRTHREQITFFKSVGNAVQDAACASLALRNAWTLGLGNEIAW